jgi:ribosomal protein L11
MAMMIVLGTPPMSVMVDEEFDLAKIRKKYGKFNKLVEIVSASGRHHITRAENIVYIKDMTAEELKDAMARIAAEKADPRDENRRRMITPAPMMPHGRRSN